MKEYRFVDHWRIKAPIDEVYGHVANPRTYHQWWRAYDGVRILNDKPFPYVGGKVELLVRSPFGYRLRLEVETVAADPPRTIKTITHGQLEGVGLWQFTQEGETTHAVWTWIVRSNHPRLNKLEWFAKPVFALSHVIVSRRGQCGLKRLLEPQPAIDPYPIP